MGLDEWNIGGGYNAMRLMEIFKDFMDAVLKLVYLLD